MEIKQIKELMAAMERCGTTKVQLKDGSFELVLERVGQEMTQSVRFSDSDDEGFRKFGGSQRSNAPLPRTTDMGSALHAVENSSKELPGVFITSPMVGTYYSAPSPDESDFVKVGDAVEKGQRVCIIEAMKVMNEIKSQVSGSIIEILVESGQPVEFGTKLFRIQ